MKVAFKENYTDLVGISETNFETKETYWIVAPIDDEALTPYLDADVELIKKLWDKLGGIYVYSKSLDLLKLSLSQLRNLKRSVEKRLNRSDFPLNFQEKLEDIKKCLKHYVRKNRLDVETAESYYFVANSSQKLVLFLAQLKAEISARFNLKKAAKFKKECPLPKEDHLMALDQKLRAPKVNRDLFRGDMSELDLETKICYGIQDGELETLYKEAQAKEFA